MLIPTSNLRDLFNSVHIWRYRSEVQNFGASKFISLEKAYELLSVEEKLRFKKFKFDAARNEFLFNRSLLRLILAEYTGEKPNKIEFNYNKYGKPELKNNKYGLTFNLSHSNGYGIIAVSLDCDVGVDVEEERYDFNYEDILPDYFSASEAKLIHSFPEKQKSFCFYDLWAMKEAILKAAGTGMSYPMKELDLSDVLQAHKKIIHLKNYYSKYEKDYEIYKIDTNDEKYHAFFAIEKNGFDHHVIDYKNYQELISDQSVFKSYSL